MCMDGGDYSEFLICSLYIPWSEGKLVLDRPLFVEQRNAALVGAALEERKGREKIGSEFVEILPALVSGECVRNMWIECEAINHYDALSRSSFN